MAQDWTITADGAGAIPDPLTVNNDDTITWSNGGGDELTLNLPDCVTPNTGPVKIPAGDNSGPYTVTPGKPRVSNYTWSVGTGPVQHGKIRIVDITTWAPISLTPNGAVPAKLNVNPGDKVRWANAYLNASITVTLPACIAPKDVSVTLKPKEISQWYTIHAQHKPYEYRWHSLSSGNDTGTIDVS